jgi:hypothetical protein
MGLYGQLLPPNGWDGWEQRPSDDALESQVNPPSK